MEGGELPAFLRQWNTAEVGRFLWDGKPVSREMAEAVHAASEQSFAARGYGLFSLRTLEARAEDDPMGFCGLRVAAGQPDPELLFGLASCAGGRGYATEAGAAVLQFAFTTLVLPTITAGANPGNLASIRVLERLGFTHTGLVHTEIEDLYTYALRREGFRALSSRLGNFP
jgi:RimJ/RimL family protein N-acetyltransferase